MGLHGHRLSADFFSQEGEGAYVWYAQLRLAVGANMIRVGFRSRMASGSLGLGQRARGICWLFRLGDNIRESILYNLQPVRSDRRIVAMCMWNR